MSRGFSSWAIADGKIGPEAVTRAAGIVVWAGPAAVTVVVMEELRRMLVCLDNLGESGVLGVFRSEGDNKAFTGLPPDF